MRPSGAGGGAAAPPQAGEPGPAALRRRAASAAAAAPAAPRLAQAGNRRPARSTPALARDGQHPPPRGHPGDPHAMTYAKVWYAMHSGSLAFVLPFLNVYLVSNGITPAEIGVLAALRPVVGTPAAAGWAAAADASGAHRAILGACFLASTAGRLAIPLAPGSFPFQLALALAIEAVAAPIPVIADAAVVAAAPDADGYGRARLWGAVGWGGLSLAAGALVAAKGVSAGFIAYAGAAAATLGPTLLLPVGALAVAGGVATGQNSRRQGGRGRPAPTPAAAAADQPPSMGKAAAQLMNDRRATVFFGLALLLGVAASTIATFLPIYLATDLGGSEALLGAAIGVACAAEVPVFYWSGALVKAVGARRLLDLAAACYIARLVGYCVIGHAIAGADGSPAGGLGAAAILPLEALHGFAFAGSWAAGTEHCAALAPSGLKTTAQSLFAAAYAGVGGGLGALAGGALYTAGGPDACFLGTAALVAVGWVVLSTLEAAGGDEEGDGQGIVDAGVSPRGGPPRGARPAPAALPTSPSSPAGRVRAGSASGRSMAATSPSPPPAPRARRGAGGRAGLAGE